MIRAARPIDAASIARIYNYYIENTVITFEESLISCEEVQSRMEDGGSGLPWHVFDSGGRIAGYAYASRWNGRCAYRNSVESTGYLDQSEVGKGIGNELGTSEKSSWL